MHKDSLSYSITLMVPVKYRDSYDNIENILRPMWTWCRTNVGEANHLWSYWWEPHPTLSNQSYATFYFEQQQHHVAFSLVYG